MLILVHRAQDVEEPIPSRFGVEIDVRDAFVGEPYVSHNPVHVDPDYETQSSPLYYWLERDIEKGERPIYAINIKADGIEMALMETFKTYPSIWAKTFFFDGSFPTMRRLKNLNVPVAERISEEEPYRGHSHIIWLDRWDWMDGEGAIPEGQPSAASPDKNCRVPIWDNKQGRITEVYAVSPELHRPNCSPGYRQFWWRRFQQLGCVGICTDYWLECEDFFLGDTINAIKGPILAAKYDIGEEE